MLSKVSEVRLGLAIVGCAGYTFSKIGFSLVTGHTLLFFDFIWDFI